MPAPNARRKGGETHADTHQSAVDATGLNAQTQRMSAATPTNASVLSGNPAELLHSPVNVTNAGIEAPLKHEDYALELMENGTADGILQLIRHTAKLFLDGVPSSKTVDALAKIINQKEGGQEQNAVKVKVLEDQIQNLEQTLKQLEVENAELKNMEEKMLKTAEPQGNEAVDAKHGVEDRQKKSKPAKTDKKKK